MDMTVIMAAWALKKEERPATEETGKVSSMERLGLKKGKNAEHT